MWKWLRRYYRLENWRWKMASDYAYETVLKTSLAAACSNVCCVPPPGGIVAWWPGEPGQASGTIDDIAAPYSPGTAVGGAGYASGMVGTSLRIAASGDYVTVPHAPKLNLGARFSIQAWISGSNTAPTGSARTIVSKRPPGSGSGYWLYVTEDKLNLALQTGSSSWLFEAPATALLNGCWRHVVVTADPGLIRLYVDGRLIKQYTTSGIGSLANTEPLWIGGSPTDPTDWFNGRLDEVALFNRVLTPSEVTAVYDAGEKGMCRESCRIPPVSACGPSGQAALTATFCNYTSDPRFYVWSLAPLAPGPGCTANGPTPFSPPRAGWRCSLARARRSQASRPPAPALCRPGGGPATN